MVTGCMERSERDRRAGSMILNYSSHRRGFHTEIELK